MSDFAEVLKKLMSKKKLTIAEVSRETAIPASTISEWCNGREPLFSNNLIKLAKYFNISLEQLLTGSTKEEQLIGDIISNNVNSFTQIHKGIYRITVEKQAD